MKKVGATCWGKSLLSAAFAQDDRGPSWRIADNLIEKPGLQHIGGLSTV
jgi:hypothetical protein